MKTTHKVGDDFWLIIAPYNPIAVKVKVLEVVSDMGYWVDEPVGMVNNPKCVFDSAEDARKTLKLIHDQFGGKDIPTFFEWSLEGVRGFLLTAASETNYPNVSRVLNGIYPPKAEGIDWFKLQ